MYYSNEQWLAISDLAGELFDMLTRRRDTLLEHRRRQEAAGSYADGWCESEHLPGSSAANAPPAVSEGQPQGSGDAFLTEDSRVLPATDGNGYGACLSDVDGEACLTDADMWLSSPQISAFQKALRDEKLEAIADKLERQVGAAKANGGDELSAIEYLLPLVSRSDRSDLAPAQPISEQNDFGNSACSASSSGYSEVQQVRTCTIDRNDYVLASVIIRQHTPPGIVLNHKKLRRFLEPPRGIRTTRPLTKDGRPRSNRLLVHLGDWHKNFEALSDWYRVDRSPECEVPIEEVAERYSAVHGRKLARK